MKPGNVPLLIGLAAGGAYLLWATRLPQCADEAVVELAQDAISEMWIVGDVSEVVELKEETSDKERVCLAKITTRRSSPFWVKYTVKSTSGIFKVRLLSGKVLR